MLQNCTTIKTYNKTPGDFQTYYCIYIKDNDKTIVSGDIEEIMDTDFMTGVLLIQCI